MTGRAEEVPGAFPSPYPDASRATALAASGLAARLARPGRLHALNGHLHNAAMLANLLARDPAEPVRKRGEAIAQQIEALERELGVWQSLVAGAPAEPDAQCNATAALARACALLATEAVRVQVALWTHLPGRELSAASGDAPMVRAVVLCGLALLQRAPRHSTVTLAAHEHGHTLAIEIAAPCTVGETELQLLADVVREANGRLVPEPALTIEFRLRGHEACA